jgi:hypothetical protein
MILNARGAKPISNWLLKLFSVNVSCAPLDLERH